MQINRLNFLNKIRNVKTGKIEKTKAEPLNVNIPDSVAIDFGKIKEEPQESPKAEKPADRKVETPVAPKKPVSTVPVAIALDIDGQHMEKNIMAGVTDKEITLKIKHTNDVHGKMPHVATLIQPEEFWIDAGDAWEGFNFHSTISLGREETELMNKRGCDLAVPGNHFFDNEGKKAGEKLVRQANFPYLGANIEGFMPYAIAEVEGAKIAFIGVQTTKKEFPMVDPKKVEDVKLSDPLEAVKKSIEEVKAKGVNNIVVISHLGLKPHGIHSDNNTLTDVSLAGKLEGIDLIIGGHTHTPTLEPLKVNNTTIVHAGKDGREDSDFNRMFIGDLTIKINRETGRITSIEDRLIEVDQKGRLDKDVADINFRHRQKTAKALQKKMGHLAGTLTHELKTPTDSTIGNLITDAIRIETGADVVLLDSSFFSPIDPLKGKAKTSIIPKGDFTMKDLAKASFWMGSVNSNIEIMDVSGETIKKVLEDGIEKLLNGKSTQGIYQVSGLKMEYDPEGNPGDRVRGILVGGKPIDLNKNYKLATSHVQANWNPIISGENKGNITVGDEIRGIVKRYLGKVHSKQSLTSENVSTRAYTLIDNKKDEIIVERDKRIQVVKGKLLKLKEQLEARRKKAEEEE